MSSTHPIELLRFEPRHVDRVVSLAFSLDWPSYTNPSTVRTAFSAPGAITWVATDQDEVIGLAHLLTDGVVQSHLSLVGVLPGHRRQGVARRLIAAAFREAGSKWIDLCSEPGAEDFYRSFRHSERTGFRIYPAEDGD